MSDFSAEAAAAKRAAARIGLGAAEPRILAVSEHVVMHLSPAPVVARVKRGGAAGMRREMDVARYLADRGAPVLAPLADFCEEQGFAVGFWPLVAHEAADGDDETHQILAAESLRRVHAAFADYPGELPPFRRKIEECRALLLGAPPGLAAKDRDFLLALHDEIAAGLPAERVPIHGDAGFHNLFLTEAGPLWTDFEAACLGPRAWDFAALGHEDDPLMATARSFCVSVWCWARADLPGKREAAEYHLNILKKA